jgi:hypothetical protein
MTTSENKANEQLLRDAFRTMDPHAAQEIREAYYKAIEGLTTLAQALEAVDAKNLGPASNMLLEEHLIACEALTTMDRSQLGRIL